MFNVAIGSVFVRSSRLSIKSNDVNVKVFFSVPVIYSEPRGLAFRRTSINKHFNLIFRKCNLKHLNCPIIYNNAFSCFSEALIFRLFRNNYFYLKNYIIILYSSLRFEQPTTNTIYLSFSLCWMEMDVTAVATSNWIPCLQASDRFRLLCNDYCKNGKGHSFFTRPHSLPSSWLEEKHKQYSPS